MLVLKISPSVFPALVNSYPLCVNSEIGNLLDHVKRWKKGISIISATFHHVMPERKCIFAVITFSFKLFNPYVTECTFSISLLPIISEIYKIGSPW